MLFISVNVDILTLSVSIPEVFKSIRNSLVSYFNCLCVFVFISKFTMCFIVCLKMLLIPVLFLSFPLSFRRFDRIRLPRIDVSKGFGNVGLLNILV